MGSGQVYEKDLGKVHIGRGASITTDAYPGRVFRGQVSYVDPKVDPQTRTAQARIELANPGQQLKIGMYVNVTFAALAATGSTVPAVLSVRCRTSVTDRWSSWLPAIRVSSRCGRYVLVQRAMVLSSSGRV